MNNSLDDLSLSCVICILHDSLSYVTLLSTNILLVDIDGVRESDLPSQWLLSWLVHSTMKAKKSLLPVVMAEAQL